MVFTGMGYYVFCAGFYFHLLICIQLRLCGVVSVSRWKSEHLTLDGKVGLLLKTVLFPVGAELILSRPGKAYIIQVVLLSTVTPPLSKNLWLQSIHVRMPSFLLLFYYLKLYFDTHHTRHRLTIRLLHNECCHHSCRHKDFFSISLSFTSRLQM